MAQVGTSLARTVLATIRQRELLERGDRVVVAVSGGPDSMALLDVLAELREELDLWLCVAHLNHGLREAAAADAEFVAAHVAERGLPFHSATRDVAADREEHGGSIEMAARRVRYAFLADVAAEVGATKVATGHTADDQVETILQRLLRGGGLDALCGMPASRPLAPGSDVAVVRPLITASRDEVLAHLAERGLGYRVDETNADTSFQRNAIRLELLPLLTSPGGKPFRDEVLRISEQARELASLVDVLADELVIRDGDEARVDVAALAEAPYLSSSAAVRRAFAAAGGGGPVPRDAVDAILHLLHGGSGREVTLPDGVVARREYGSLVFGRRAKRPTRLPSRGKAARCELAVPGTVEVADAGLWVEAQALKRRPRRFAPDDPWEEVVDLERAGEPLVVRGRESGDRFAPLGLGASKKLKDFFVDARVPREERCRALIVEGPRGIVWVVGHRLDERARVRRETRRFARLRAGRLGS